MPYSDLIPTVFPLSIESLANNTTSRSAAFNVGDKMALGVVVKAGAALKVAIAYGKVGDTDGSLPYATDWTTFASANGSTESGTYHELEVPPEAQRAQLLVRNESGSTVTDIEVDAALRVVAFPASGGGGGSSDFGDIIGWPGASTDFIRGDGSDAPLAASEVRGIVTGTSGEGKVIADDGAGGLEWITPSSTGNYSRLVGAFGKSADQTISASTATDVTYNVHTIGPLSEISHSTSSSPAQTTANSTMNYTVEGTFQYVPTTGSTNVDLTVELKKNGTTVTDGTWTFNAYKATGNNYMWPVQCRLSLPLAATDVIKFVITPNAASNGSLKSTFRMWAEY